MKKSMKKFIVACAAVSAMTVAAGMSAMAADYSADTNSVSITVPSIAAADTQKTVLVIPAAAKNAVTESDILYINQDSTLPATALLKGDSLADGNYLVLVGYYDADGTFAISEDPFTVGNSEETREILMGDVNVDEVVNSVDAQQILRYGVKGTASFSDNADALIAADVNADETINSVDAQQVLRYGVKGESGSNAGKTAVVTADGTIKEYK